MGRFVDAGLTGGIATGKSLVASIFQALGAAVIDADKVYHELTAPGEKLHRKIVKTFGPAILAADESIDRKRLAEVVFSDESNRQKLNKLAHPAVIRERKRRAKEVKKAWKKEGRDQGVIITEAALLVEAGTYSQFDSVIIVTCEPEIQLRRLMERDGISREKAQARIASQMPLEEKEAFADHLIHNNGSSRELIRSVEEVYARLCRDAAN